MPGDIVDYCFEHSLLLGIPSLFSDCQNQSTHRIIRAVVP